MTMPPLRPSTSQRLAFAEFRLFWYGRLNRSDLTTTFGISPSQATQDLAYYQRQWPGNLSYDDSQRCYLPGPGFVPRMITISAEGFLEASLARRAEGALPGMTWQPELPAMVWTRRPQGHIRPVILRDILRAIEARLAMDILFQDDRTDTPQPLRIEPHALGHDGDQWNVRAYCPSAGGFRSFLLVRITGSRLPDPEIRANSTPASDVDWQDQEDIVLAPRADLPQAEKRAVTLEYGLDSSGQLRLPVRRALMDRVLRQFARDGAPHDPRLVLLRPEQEEYRRRA